MIEQQVLKKNPRFKQNKTFGWRTAPKKKQTKQDTQKTRKKRWLQKRRQNKTRSKAKAQGEAGEARERQVRRPLAGRGGTGAAPRPRAWGGGARLAAAGPPPTPRLGGGHSVLKLRTWTELGQRSMGLERARRSCLVSSSPQGSGGRGLESSRWTTRRREGEGCRIPDARPSQAASRSEGDVTSA